MHCSEAPCAFGLLGGRVSREPLIWRVLVQSIYSESPGSHSSPCPCTKCHPCAQCSPLPPCGLAGGPGEIQASCSSQEELSSPGPGCVGSLDSCSQLQLRRMERAPPLIWMQLEETSQKP